MKRASARRARVVALRFVQRASASCSSASSTGRDRASPSLWKTTAMRSDLARAGLDLDAVLERAEDAAD